MSVSPAPDPRPAASLIIIRQGPTLEVLVGRRGDHIRAFPGATAFPGGKIEPQDHDWPGAAQDLGTAAAYAALREAFEETGLLVCGDGLGPPVWADVAEARSRVEDARISFRALLTEWGRTLDVARLTPFARFTTPPSYPYRFDTWFFLVEASAVEAASGLICAEFETLRWATPTSLLDDPEVRLPRPTRANLQRLSECGSVAEAMEMAVRTGLYDGRPKEPLAS